MKTINFKEALKMEEFYMQNITLKDLSLRNQILLWYSLMNTREQKNSQKIDG